MKKVIFAASSGGHLSEMMCLSKLFNEYDYLLITERTELTETMQTSYNMKLLKYGPNSNIIKYVFTLIYNLIMSFVYVMKFRPDTVVSTGAQIGGFVCVIGKLFGAKIIYIETLAKVNSLSRTGNNVYKFADRFYVQWKNLEEKYDKAKYIGRLM